MAELVVEDEGVRRALELLAAHGSDRATADALNRTAFDVLEAETAHVLDVFTFAGPNTERFVSRSFRFRKATQDAPFVDVFPLRKGEEILRTHVRGELYGPSDVEKLEVETELGRMFAVPVGVKRGASGKVPARLDPVRLLGPGGRGFVSGNVLLRRRGKARTPVEILYALVPRAKNPPDFRFYEVARDTVRRVFAAKAARAITKEAELAAKAKR